MFSAQKILSSLLATDMHGRVQKVILQLAVPFGRRSQLVQLYLVTCKKNLEEVVFVDKEVLNKKTNNKDVYVSYGTIPYILKDGVKQYGDLTALK